MSIRARIQDKLKPIYSLHRSCSKCTFPVRNAASFNAVKLKVDLSTYAFHESICALPFTCSPIALPGTSISQSLGQKFKPTDNRSPLNCSQHLFRKNEGRDSKQNVLHRTVVTH